MARLDAGEFELDLEPNSMADIVAAALAALQDASSAAGPCDVEVPPTFRRCASTSRASKTFWCA